MAFWNSPLQSGAEDSLPTPQHGPDKVPIAESKLHTPLTFPTSSNLAAFVEENTLMSRVLQTIIIIILNNLVFSITNGSSFEVTPHNFLN